jgi:hypothetical protein
MKNLVVFVTPMKRFFGEYATLVRVWIDNSLDLGWSPDDLMAVTNFDFRYNGVRSLVVPDDNYCASRPRSIKTSIIPHLADAGLLLSGQLYWNHDLDAFQMNKFNGLDEDLAGVDMGLTDYGWRPRWCMGSYFFRDSAKDVFDMASQIIHGNVEDEDAIQKVQDSDPDGFEARHKRLNITYNFGMRRVEGNWKRADKPIRVVHFHPNDRRLPTWDIFVLGKNGLNLPLVDERLAGVLRHHGMGR